MIRRFALAALFLVTACASGPPKEAKPADSGSTGATPASSSADKANDSSADAAKRELRLGQTLMDLDKRVDRYVRLASEPGDDAKIERSQLGHALEAQVAQVKPDLLRMMADPSNEQRRRVAAKALAFSDDPAAATALAKVLGDKGDATLLTNATFALARIHSPTTPTEPLLALVHDLDPDIRSNALLALWHIFDARRGIGASPLDPVAQREAMTLLETALFDPADPIVRANAAAAMGALGDPRAVDPLINNLRDTHPLIRTQTAIALGKIGDDKAIPALVTIIDSTPSGTPRTAVILSLKVLLEKKGIHPPESLGDEGRAWERFVRDHLGSDKK